MTIQEKIIILLAGIIMQAALCSGLYWYAYHRGNAAATQRYELAISKLQTAAATTLADETEKTRAAEAALRDHTQAQEIQDAQHQIVTTALSDRLAALAGQSGRLRDPHATAGCGRGSGGAQSAAATASADRPADPTQTDGLLSAELSGLLRQRLREADDINNAYTSCRADAYTVRSVP